MGLRDKSATETFNRNQMKMATNYWNFSKRHRQKSIRLKMNSRKLKLKIFIKTRDRLTTATKPLTRNSATVFWIPNKDKELEELIEAYKNDVYFPVSCQEYADSGSTQNGSYRVQPNTNISRKCIKLIKYVTYHMSHIICSS